MHVKALAFALSAVTLTAVADNIYTVNANTTEDLSLVAAGCVTDRIQFGSGNNFKLMHRVTDATGTLENPFTFVGNYGGYVFAESGLGELPLCVNFDNPTRTLQWRFYNTAKEGAPEAAANYVNAGDHSLVIKRGVFYLANFDQYGTAETPRVFTLNEGAKLWAYKLALLKNADFRVEGGALESSIVNLASPDVAQPARLTIRQATAQVTQRWLQFCSEVQDVETASSCNTVVLDEGGVLSVPSIEHYRKPQADITFRGGKLVHDVSRIAEGDLAIALKPYLIHQTGTGIFSLKAETGPIVLDIQQSERLPKGVKFMRDDVWQGQMHLIGDRGFVKQGAGTLVMTKGETGSIFPNVTGGVTIEGGTLKLTTYGFDKSNVLTIARGATLDLNGNNATFAAIRGEGTVMSSVPGVTLTIDGAEASTFNGTIGAGVTLVKAGTGTLSLLGSQKGEGLLKIVSGRVDFEGMRPNKGYRHYRFQVLGVYGTNPAGVQFSELKLMDEESDVTRPFVSVSCGAPHFATSWADRNTAVDTGMSYEGVDKTVDGQTGTKWNDWRGQPSRFPTEGDNLYVQLDYAEEQIVTKYAWATANDKPSSTQYDCRDPNAWTLLGSDDGETWVELDRREAFTPPDGRETYTDFFTTSYPADLFAKTLSNFTLASGVVLDAGKGPLELAHLAINGSDLGATITHFTATENGVLELTLPPGMTFAQFVGDGGVDLLTVGEIVNNQNLKTWSVKVNGAIETNAALRHHGGKLWLGKAKGLVVVFR